MGYYKTRGIIVDAALTAKSIKYFYITGGNVIDEDTDIVHIVSEAKFEKNPGMKYIYYDGSVLYVRSGPIVDEKPLYFVMIEENGSMLTLANGVVEELTKPVLIFYDDAVDFTASSIVADAVETLNVAVEDMEDAKDLAITDMETAANETDEFITAAVEEAKATGFTDTRNETYTEVHTVVNGRIITNNVINDIISLYVENLGELDLSSINSIMDTELTFDSNLNNLNIEVVYTSIMV